MKTLISIDDTGTPGKKSKSKYDDGYWKTWIAIVFEPQQVQFVKEQFGTYLEEQKTNLSINEFHFTDIYSGKGEFKKLSVKDRIKIFWDFAHFYSLYRFPIYTQSFTRDDIIRNGIIIKKKLRAENFDLSDNSDIGLMYLLQMLKKYLKDNPTVYPTPVDFHIDSGRQEPNTTHKISFLKNIATKSSLNYYSSQDSVFIQLADFIAFLSNRVRWILMNDKKDESDYQILSIYQHCNTNSINLPTRLINFEEFSSKDYDNILKEKYIENNNLSEYQIGELKRKFAL